MGLPRFTCTAIQCKINPIASEIHPLDRSTLVTPGVIAVAPSTLMAMDFTITLSKDDWDSVKGGWRCPALQIPGTRVQSIYVDGAAVDPKYYEVNNALSLIRWSPDARPKQASVHIHADKALSTEELTLKWRKLAIILPVAGSLAAALITAVVAPLFKAPSVGVEGKSKAPFLKIFERSNDFLATGDSHQFPSLLKAAKREAWFVGTTFYITTDQYHDQLLSKLSEGVDLNFLILSPDGAALGKVAQLLGVQEKELLDNCTSGIIPNPIDQNPWVHWRSPMDMMRQGWSTSLFHAAQQWSTRSS